MAWVSLGLTLLIGFALFTSTAWGIYKTYKIHKNHGEKDRDRH
ncbi:hypothetical protein [Desulfurobacterium sp.]